VSPTNHIGALKNRKKESKLNHKKFQKELKAASLEGKQRDGIQTKYTFSPSTVGYGYGTCARYWQFAFNGVIMKDTFTAEGMAAMENGTAAHERIQKALTKITESAQVKEIERELKIVDPPVRGFIDVILEVEGEEVVGEIKTIKAEQYDIRKMTQTPSESHLVQILIYMKGTGATEGFFLYENKNTHEVSTFPILMDEENEEYINYIFDWMREVRQAWEEKKNVKRGYTKSSYQCKYCPIFDACQEAPDGRTNIEPLQVKKL
jgi:CRISPR/Cas system-associated exonuclease Cas4 (RecB family)